MAPRITGEAARFTVTTLPTRPHSHCQARLGTLQCSREAHAGRGHVYVTGSWVPDRHGPVGG